MGAAGVFLVVDVSFFAANLLKFLEGGFIPLLAGLLIFLLMTTWRRGIALIRARSGEKILAPRLFLEQLAAGKIPRVPGTAVFLTRIREPISPAMVLHVAQFCALQQSVATLTVEFEERPRVPRAERVTVHCYEGGVWHIIARFGFVEIPSLPAALALAHEKGCPILPGEALFIGGRDDVVRDRTPGRPRLPVWRRLLFGFMYRNAVHLADRFDLPQDRFVQIGRPVAL